MLTNGLGVSFIRTVDFDRFVSELRESEPGEALRTIASVREVVKEVEPLKVGEARSAGHSWDEIALFLGSSRQAVHRKYRHLDEGGGRRRMITLDREAQSALTVAGEVATRYGVHRVDVGHLFVGLVEDGGPASGPVLAALGTAEPARLLFGDPPVEAEKRKKRLSGNSDDLRTALRVAIDVARWTRSKHIGRGHLLAATLSFPSPVTDALSEHGLNTEDLRQKVVDLL